ncbi:MAG: sulfite exporter TauE/SafE family protein [Kofleriaceae bacterium]
MGARYGLVRPQDAPAVGPPEPPRDALRCRGGTRVDPHEPRRDVRPVHQPVEDGIVIDLSITMLALLFACGVGAGLLGARIGIGGGIVLVPALVLGFGLDPKIAIATSLFAVIATSTAAGSVYVGRGLTNTRVAIALEVATSFGGLAGGVLAVMIPSRALAGVFGIVMGVTSLLMFRRAGGHDAGTLEPGPMREGYEEPGQLAGSYYDDRRGGLVHYRAKRVAAGSAIALLAGAVSGMLGVGGGFLKVPAMNVAMDIPITVAIATSNFMVGVTAAASIFVYYGRGYVHPVLVAPVVLGVIAGALASSKNSTKANPAGLKRLLATILVVVAIEMSLRALGVHFGV